MRLGMFLVMALAWVLRGAPAAAHQNSITWLRVEAAGRVVSTEFRIDALDLNEAMGAPPGLPVTRDEALAGAGRVTDYLRARYRVSDGPAACAQVAGRDARVHERADGFDLAVRVAHRCPHAIEALGLRYELFFDVDPRHQGMAAVSAFGAETQKVFRERDRALSLEHRRALGAQLREYVSLGVEHIFQGYDHLAFLCGLLLVAGARAAREAARDVLAIVTSFTAAHSLTLVSAALGWVTLSPRLVEPAIALSIAYVAFENLLTAEPRRRWALTFGFGLVHGFGFAGVLAEQGLPARAVVPSLLAFNAGVEVGQLTIVALALPVLRLMAGDRWTAPRALLAAASLVAAWLVLVRAGVSGVATGLVLFGAAPALALASRRWGYARGVRRLGSLALGAFGLLWFVERVSGWSALRGALG